MFRLRYLFPLLWGLLLIFSCEQEQEEPRLADELFSISEIRALLLSLDDGDNLITSIEAFSEAGFDYYRITLEDGRVATAKADLIDVVMQNPGLWAATFTFTDGSEQTAPLLGDSMYVAQDSITVDPYGNAPLTALINTTMPVKRRFAVEVAGGTNGISIGKAFEFYGKQHRLPVLGLYPEYDNEVRIQFMSEGGKVRLAKTYRITTGAAREIRTINIIKNELPPDDNALYFISNLSAAFDQRGAVRWTFEGGAKQLYKKLKNGNMIVASQQGVAYHSHAFSEISMLGEVIQTYEVPNLMHHEVEELPSGNFLVATNTSEFTNDRNDGELEEDLIIEMDRATGEILKRWDLNQILDNQRPRVDGIDDDDWFHLNAIFYDETDNSFLASGRHQSTVAKIGYEDGAVRWILAHPSGWREGLQDDVLTPVDENGQPVDLSTTDFLPYYQHAPLVLPNGNILLYDNGNYRNAYENPNAPEESYSRAVEYRIDEANGTVELVWEFDYNEAIFTVATGDVDYLPESGHRLIGFMNASPNTPKIVELDAADNIVFEVDVNPGASYYRCEKSGVYWGM